MADDLILKITGKKQGEIKGECKKKGHESQIDITSVSWGMNNPANMGRGGSGGTGAVTFSDISFTKVVDAASARLQTAATTGEVLTEVIFYFRKQGGKQEEYTLVTLKEAMVTNISISAGSGGEPHESVSLNFAKYEIVYKEQQPDGKLGGGIVASYDLKATV